MKRKIMIQSMSLLALLTLIRNCSVSTVDCAGQKLTWYQFLAVNGLVLIIIGTCALWVLLAAAYFVSFAAFKWSGYEGFKSFQRCPIHL